LEINNFEEPLSEELKYLYKNYDINLSFKIRNINIVNFDNLHKRQYGFKYISNDYGKTFKANEVWNKNWVVIADMNEDPIVADIGTAETPVFAGIEGLDYKKIAPSLEIFFKILIELLKSSETNSINEPDDEKDFEQWLTFREEVIIPYFIKQAENILDNECINNLRGFI
jgi:hypothetical protein